MKLISRIRTLARVKALPEGNLPDVAQVVAIIMDGNGRWARRRGLPVAAGHRAGTKALRRTVEAAIDLGIQHVIVYAFSTENWSRPQDEVDALMEIFGEIEKWTMTKSKFEVMDILNKYDVPCGPILSMKEIAEEPSLRSTGPVVEVDHPIRGKYLTVGNPIKLSDSPTDVTRSPLLGEHTNEILSELGYSNEELNSLHLDKVI